MLYQQTLKHDFENNQMHHPDNPALKTLEKKASLVHQQAEQIFYKGMITQMKKKSRDLFEQFASDPEELQKQLLKAQDKMLRKADSQKATIRFRNHPYPEASRRNHVRRYRLVCTCSSTQKPP